jgi:hypothetical protein
MTAATTRSPVAGRRTAAWPLILATAAPAVAVVPLMPAGVRVAMAIALVGLFLVRADRVGYPVLVVLMVWLVLLGLTRRLLTAAIGQPTLDPLLLVAPAVWAVLFTVAVRKGALRERRALSTAVLAFGAVTVAASLNASQQPLLAGITGLLFVAVPQLAFWIGRVLPTADLRRLLRAALPLTVAAALYGLVQLAWLPSWDARWVYTLGYESLNVHGTIRPFGTSSSAAEFAFLLAIGIVVWATLRSRSTPVTVFSVALLTTALFLESGRGVVIMAVVALAAIAAARRGVSPGYAAGAMAVAVLLVMLLAGFVAPDSVRGTRLSGLVAHQVDGLANPLDPQSSTFVAHLAIYGEGFRAAVDHPLGLGLGANNLASVRFGGTQMLTEQDVSNAAASLGIPGLVVFLAVAALGYWRAYGLARRTRDPVALVALGVLVVTFGQWLNGGQYGVAWLPWLLLGWVDARGAATEQSGES